MILLGNLADFPTRFALSIHSIHAFSSMSCHDYCYPQFLICHYHDWISTVSSLHDDQTNPCVLIKWYYPIKIIMLWFNQKMQCILRNHSTWHGDNIWTMIGRYCKIGNLLCGCSFFMYKTCVLATSLVCPYCM